MEKAFTGCFTLAKSWWRITRKKKRGTMKQEN